VACFTDPPTRLGVESGAKSWMVSRPARRRFDWYEYLQSTGFRNVISIFGCGDAPMDLCYGTLRPQIANGRHR
jgi:hypothetical protein